MCRVVQCQDLAYFPLDPQPCCYVSKMCTVITTSQYCLISLQGLMYSAIRCRLAHGEDGRLSHMHEMFGLPASKHRYFPHTPRCLRLFCGRPSRFCLQDSWSLQLSMTVSLVAHPFRLYEIHAKQETVGQTLQVNILH